MADRRYGKELNHAILSAAWELLAEQGYAELTMSAVAEQAHTNKNTIYRRWANKPLLVAAALEHQHIAVDTTLPNTGTLREDLMSLLSRFIPVISAMPATTWQALISDLLATSVANLNLSTLQLVVSDENWITQQLPDILKHALNRGEIQQAANPTQKSLPAVMLIRQLIFTGTLTPAQVTDIVDNILLPVYCRPTH
ncbi:AcrR family transcriptional regulator [Levilactobacillus zymae]|uniref:AcrR family transcriptional regulator n=1 Tax=Levilactobacillus zymae TaxID=267363 RepID=A0ABQ0WZ70_9LACO|nr:TetR/AcrR family transcriptional regulator [Levilactobacillus zymae]QFR61598.1 TetR family transcriptional regulator [Levilactobacillus zymae]GEO73129.1 AcrR family transcriptional regulator [Levilactobacillus zymae]